MKLHMLLFVFLFQPSFLFDAEASTEYSSKEITPVIKTSLNTKWTFYEEGQSKRYDAVVPGCVHTDLIRNNIIQDPFLSSNESACQWIGETNWIYESEPFDISDEVLKAEVVRMRFNGLDTYANVSLNGKTILRAENAHRSWEVDVKKYLNGHDNVLRIEFISAVKEGEKRLAALPYPLPGDGLRAVTRKPQFHYGWDWGPKLITCGITKPIELIAYDLARFTDLHVDQKEVTKELARLSVKFELHAAKACSGKIVCELPSTGENWTTEVELKKGITVVELPIDIPYPYLWWCNDFGKQHMYEFSASFFSDDVLIDSRKTRTGIRSVQLIQEKDSIGESFYFKLNDEPVFAKGANYIPINYYPAQATNEDYVKLLTDCKNAHINMLRVWGGGVYEEDIFYDLCDEMGIMVWQDFMFACSMYPADSSFVVNVINEAEEQTVRLRNHPCIALWCGNNENAEGWERWGWQIGLSEKNKSKLWRAYLDIFDLTLGDAVKKYTNTDYWMSSPKYGRADQRSYTEGDSHDWGVWHDENPFESLMNKIPRFMSEFGMQSFPSMEVVGEMITENTVKYDDPGLAHHQKHNRGFMLMDKYMARWYPKPDHSQLEKYAMLTQAVQAEGIGMGIEAQRRSMPRCMGSLYWQLNDVWPAFSWSGMDYKGNKKLLHKYLQILYTPQLISCVVENDRLSVFWINDNGMTPVNTVLSLQVYDHNNLYDPFNPNAQRVEMFSDKITEIELKEGVQVIYQNDLKKILGKEDRKSKVIEVKLIDSSTGNVICERTQKLTPEFDYNIVPQFFELKNSKGEYTGRYSLYYKNLDK